MRDIDLAWAAGIVDGEGSINLIKMKRYDSYGTGLTFDLRLDVGNTDPRMLVRLKDIFGGSISSNLKARPNRKPTFCWHLHGAKAAEAIQLMRPYLVIKGEQADLALISRQFVRHNKKCDAAGLEKTYKMAACSEMLKDLKKRLPTLEEALQCPQLVN